jgi:cytochrome P450
VAVGVASVEQEVLALFNGERLRDPFAVWNAVREEAPVFRAGSMVLVTRYEDIPALVSTGPPRFSAKLHLIGSRPEQIVAELSPPVRDKWRELAAYEAMQMTRKDGDEHDRLRRIAHRYFTPRMIARLEEQIAELVDELLTRSAAEEVYDQRALMQEYAARVMAFVIGSPQVDWKLLVRWATAIGNYAGRGGDELVLAAHAARFEFREYIDTVIIPAYRDDPGSNPLVASLMEAEGQENLSADEMNAMIMLLLFAGAETTATLLSNTMAEFMSNRTQWELLCEDPAGRVSNTVEELIRYLTPAQWIPRTALEDYEHEGVEIAAGTTVIGAIAAGNHDPRVYDDPDTFDILREVAPPHLGFGFGQRFCLGSSLVRAEARIFLQALAERYPDVSAAVEPDEFAWAGNPIFRSLSTLPLRLGPREI